jgi:ribonuclease HI
VAKSARVESGIAGTSSASASAGFIVGSEIFFDGACRQNGNSEARGCSAVFVEDFKNKYNRVTIHEPRPRGTPVTNNFCELYACIDAVEVARKIAAASTITEFWMKGDTDMIISAITSGRVFTFNTSTRNTNGPLWKKLKDQLEFARMENLVLHWQWVPRSQNTAPDEMCNAAMDGRVIDTSKAHLDCTTASTAEIQRSIFIAADHILTFRQRSLSFLPKELFAILSAVIASFLALPVSDEAKRVIFMIAPMIVSAHQSRISSRKDFKSLRSHLTMLLDRQYLFQTLLFLAQKRQTTTPRSEPNEEKRIRGLVYRGLLDKIVQKDDNIAAITGDAFQADRDSFVNKLTALFPQRDLPEPLVAIESCEWDFTDVVSCVSRLKRGKAPGLSGWVRELLLPVVTSLPFAQRPIVCQFFERWSTGSVSPIERRLLTDGVLTLLQDKSTGKLRPIVQRDCLAKILWLHALRRVIPLDKNLTGHGSSFARSDGCIQVVHAIQSALHRGLTIVSLDAKNAFNSICRHALPFVIFHFIP